MITSRWWLLTVAGAGAGMIAILVAVGTSGPQLLVGIAIAIGYLGLFLALRSRIHEGDRWAMVFLGATVLWAAGLTAVSPELAVSQFVAFPMVWVLAGSVRHALVGSLLLAIGVGAGFWISFGGGIEALPAILLTQMLSFGFAVIMGIWISHIAELGQQKSRLLDELTAAQDELAALHRDAGVTAERARMSREVHDTVAQSLTGLVLLGQRARRAYAAGTLDDDTLELIETGARDALAETRALVAAAAPVELAHGGIETALERLAERFERETRIRVSTAIDLPHPLPRDAEVVLLRCAQEGLANVRKHSAAAKARVELSLADGTARLRVSDDGRGFTADDGGGFGLAGLRDRLALAGGTLEIDGTPAATSITATLPVGDVAVGGAA